MLIKIEDLEVGDEVIIAGGQMKYLRILRKPKLSKSLSWNGGPRYSSMKCSTKFDIVAQTRTYMSGGTPRTYNYNEKVWGITGDGHNRELYQDLNDRPIWLVKKAGQL